jgi:hypothetical protein
VAFNPQPRCDGLQYTREVPLADGMYTEGAFFVLTWDIIDPRLMIGLDTNYVVILKACGLETARTANVTVYGPTENYGAARYNAEAVKPIVGAGVTRNQFYIRNLSILFRKLTVL